MGLGVSYKDYYCPVEIVLEPHFLKLRGLGRQQKRSKEECISLNITPFLEGGDSRIFTIRGVFVKVSLGLRTNQRRQKGEGETCPS